MDASRRAGVYDIALAAEATVDHAEPSYVATSISHGALALVVTAMGLAWFMYFLTQFFADAACPIRGPGADARFRASAA
jgi:hypothetical protein